MEYILRVEIRYYIILDIKTKIYEIFWNTEMHQWLAEIKSYTDIMADQLNHESKKRSEQLCDVC